MSGGASSGGGSTRSVAGSPTSLRKPSKWKGWKPISAFAPSVSAMKVCGTPLGPNANEPAGSDRRRVADVDGELALEHVEPLVLVGVDVPGRALAGAHGDLEQPVLAARVVAADLDDLEHPQQPVRLALVLAEQVAVLRTLCRNGRHLTHSLPSELV